MKKYKLVYDFNSDEIYTFNANQFMPLFQTNVYNFYLRYYKNLCPQF